MRFSSCGGLSVGRLSVPDLGTSCTGRTGWMCVAGRCAFAYTDGIAAAVAVSPTVIGHHRVPVSRPVRTPLQTVPASKPLPLQPRRHCARGCFPWAH
ncbi:hypothetical protein EYR27_05220 [Xanthomonas oryzae]|nr:hypothetical protein EYR27_05220 [Xanthomonas oryzae]